MNKLCLKMRRVALLLFAAVLALGTVACSSGPNDEQVIRTTIDNTFASYKDPSSLDVNQVIDAEVQDVLGESGIEAKEFLSHSFMYLAYTVDDVTVDGNAAQVKMTISNVNIDEAMSKALEEFDTWTNKGDDALKVYQESGDQGLYRHLFDNFYQQIDEMSSKPVSTEVTVLMEKKEDGSWDMTSEGNDAFYKALYGCDQLSF